jgi:hypothetical protein
VVRAGVRRCCCCGADVELGVLLLASDGFVVVAVVLVGMSWERSCLVMIGSCIGGVAVVWSYRRVMFLLLSADAPAIIVVVVIIRLRVGCSSRFRCSPYRLIVPLCIIHCIG